MPDRHVIAPPPLINEGPFEPRPPGAMTPEEAPYRYVVAYTATRMNGHQQIRGNLEIFMPGPIRGGASVRAAREVVAKGLNKGTSGPWIQDDVHLKMIHLLAKEA